MVAGSTVVAGYERAAIVDTSHDAIHILPTLGGLTSEARDINSGGLVVGSSDTAAGERHPFLWIPKSGQMIDLGSLGGGYGGATSLNDAGDIVGSSTTAEGQQHAFVRSPVSRVMRDLGTLGGDYSEATSINKHGYIVGSAFNATDGSRAFVWNPKTSAMKDIGVLAGTNLARANDINDSQVVVGESFSPGDNSSRPFIWTNHSSRPIALGGTFAFGIAIAVGRHGTSVGWASDEAFNPRAMIWLNQGRDQSQLAAPAGENAYALGINGNNRVVGTIGGQLVRWDRT